MAYVVPNSTIYLLSNVPLSLDHRDTYYFESEAQQQSYFRSKIAFTFTAQSYQRVNRNKIRLQLAPAQNVYQCNYVMFTNSSHWNNKWFYAFVTKIDYINENCAEITYVIDVIQTWFFQYNEEQCLVLRQSPNNDSVGNNLQPENFDCGEYVQNSIDIPQDGYEGESGYTYDYIGVLYLNNMKNNDGFLFDNVFSAATLYVFRCTSAGISALNSFIDGHISETIDGVTSYYPDNIIGIYMLPHTCFDKNDQPDNGEAFSGNFDSASWHFTISGRGSSLNGYTPHYKKLLTAPYNFLVVDCGNGQSARYEYEYFYDPTAPIFFFHSNVIPPCSITVYPEAYKGSGTVCTAESFSCGDYPLCSWSTDAWVAWLGQNSSLPLTEQISSGYATGIAVMESMPSVSQVPSMLSDVFGTAAKGVSALAGIMLTGKESVRKISDSVDDNSIGGYSKSTNYDIVKGLAMTNPAYRASDVTHGNIYNGSNWYSDYSRNKFKFRRMSITAEFARKIDSYFDAFGYAVNAIQQPIRRARTRYTYVQTSGCSVTGAISAEAAEEIASCYDNGIRFWNYSQTGDTIGVYTITQNNDI